MEISRNRKTGGRRWVRNRKLWVKVDEKQMKMGIRWVRSRKTGEEGILETDKDGKNVDKK